MYVYVYAAGVLVLYVGLTRCLCVCLQAPKATVDELSVVSSSCYRLNSLQLRAILSRYRPARDEPAISPDLVENIVRVSRGGSHRRVRVNYGRDCIVRCLG